MNAAAAAPAFRASLATSAAPAAAGDLAAQTLPWLGVFAAAVLVAWIVALILKRWLNRDPGGPVGGFNAEALDRMRADGELTDAQIRAITRAAAERAERVSESPERPGTGSDRHA